MRLTPKILGGIGGLVQTISHFKSKEVDLKVYPSIGIQYQLLKKSVIFSSVKIGSEGWFYYKNYLGFSHEFAPSYKLFVLIKSSTSEKIFFSGGLRYQRPDGNEFIFQINSKNYPIAAAYHLVKNHFSFRLSMYYHLQLGVSNHVGIGYQSLE